MACPPVVSYHRTQFDLIPDKKKAKRKKAKHERAATRRLLISPIDKRSITKSERDRERNTERERERR